MEISVAAYFKFSFIRLKPYSADFKVSKIIYSCYSLLSFIHQDIPDAS